MMMRMKPMNPAGPQHDATVRLAVKAVLTGEVPITRLAQDLGIGVVTIRRWVRDAIDQSPHHETFDLIASEVERLRRENAELRRIVVDRNRRLSLQADEGLAKPAGRPPVSCAAR